ncbi:protein TIC 20, chloroplastic-like [Silene latifolia]|uniref:protein TIC 20, chloroplastic-like n=1 Tax=Silene latifolia TaxID=37657 RepID=UPI003D76F70D
MQALVAKPFTCTPICPTLKPRLRSHIAARLEVPTNLPFRVKAAFPCIKLNATARTLQVHALTTPFMSTPLKFDPLNCSAGKLFMSTTQKFNPLNCSAGNLPEKRRTYLRKASKYPPRTEKPKWWLRSLAGLPYLLPFIDQLSWTLAHPNNPSPFLENFDNFVFPLISTFLSLPKFLLATYSIILYFWIVRRKEWPHFLRFHVMMGILLGTMVQTIGVSGNWFPAWAFPPYFWSIATFIFVIIILECIRCALLGEYAGFPFVKDAAFMHSDLNLR